MEIRSYHLADLPAIVMLFRETVHRVAARDYSQAELDAWAPAEIDVAAWAERLADNHTRVAAEKNRVLGFAELAAGGHIEMLYVAADRQSEGIATQLLAHMETAAALRGLARLTTHASRTARPFFERRGFDLLSAQHVERQGIFIENFIMEKRLSAK